MEYVSAESVQCYACMHMATTLHPMQIDIGIAEARDSAHYAHDHTSGFLRILCLAGLQKHCGMHAHLQLRLDELMVTVQ